MHSLDINIYSETHISIYEYNQSSILELTKDLNSHACVSKTVRANIDGLVCELSKFVISAPSKFEKPTMTRQARKGVWRDINYYQKLEKKRLIIRKT